MSGTASNKPPASKPAAPTNGWTRRDRPCDACRRRKTRCIVSVETEPCILCQSRSEECTFVQSPKRRKRRLEDDVSEDAGSKPRSPEVEQNIRANLPLSDYTEIKGPSLLKQTLGLQNRQHTQYLGLTTEYDSRLINLSPFDRKGEYVVGSPGTLRRVSQQTHFIVKSDSLAEMEEEIKILDDIQNIVKPHGQALVDLYFRIVHPSFPILHKKVFLEKYGRTHREFTPPVLAAVYILALNWWSFSPELVTLPKPNVAELEKLVSTTLSDVLNRPKLSTVQAGLLLLQRPEGDSWALTGQLVSVAQNLGLHLDCSKWNIPEWERALRKRLWWALYMQDKWGALVHGRPSHILRDNWDVQPLDFRDFPENSKDENDEEGSAEVETGRLLFYYMNSLTEILSDIFNAFYTLKSIADFENYDGNPTMIILEKAKPLQLRLKEWYSKLPAALAISETKAKKLSSTGYLHLAYYAAEITLHRAIIRFDSSNTDQHLRQITRGAARMRFMSATEFIKRLTPAHLQSFWYFASKVNLAIIGTFGSLLWATSDNAEECEFYKSQLAEYRWTLRVSSKSAEFMKFTVGMLDASTVFLNALHANPSPSSAPNTEAEQEQDRDIGRNDQDEDATIRDDLNHDMPQFDYSTFGATMTAHTDMTAYGSNFSGGSSSAAGDGGLNWENLNSPEAYMTGVTPEGWTMGQYNFNFEGLQGGAAGNGVNPESMLGLRGIREYDENENYGAEF